MIYRINVIGNTNNACAIRFMKPNMKYVHVKIIQSNIFNTMTAQPLAIFRLYFFQGNRGPQGDPGAPVRA